MAAHDGGSARERPLKRGIAVAISWLNPAVRVYEPDRTEAAMKHLRFDGSDQRQAVWQALTRLQRSMPPVKMLALVGEQLGM